MMNVGASCSEIMFDSMLVGPFQLATGPSAETWRSWLGIAFKDQECWADSRTGMNNLLSSREKLEYKT
jgi:hypothetical protein